MRVEALADPGPAASHLLTLAGAAILLDAGLDLEAGLWLLPPGLAADCEASSDLPPPLVRCCGDRVLLATRAPAFKAALWEASPAATALDAVLATSPAALLGLPYALAACSPGPGTPPPLVVAPDWAVDAAVAWVADLEAASASAAGGVSTGEGAAGRCWGDADLPPAAVRAMPPDTLAAVLGPTAVAALAAEPAGTPGDAPLPPAVAAARAAWRAGPYPAAAARAALAAVRRVSYGETVPLVPGGRLSATARPSGATPGGAAWDVTIHPPADRIARLVYLSSHAPWPLPASLAPHLEMAAPVGPGAGDAAAGVEALNGALGGAAAAAAPLDLAGLSGADVLVYAPPGPPPSPTGDPARLAGGPATAAAAAAAVAAVERGGCALLPIHPDGSAYALMEAAAAGLRARGLGHVPLVWAGPGAATCLAAGTAGGEWLSPPRRALLFEGRPPVGAADLRARGLLTLCAGLAQLTSSGGGVVAGGPGPAGTHNPHRTGAAPSTAPGGPAPRGAGWRAPALIFAPAASLRGDGAADGGPGATGAALARAWACDGAAALVWSLPVGGGGPAVPATAAAPFLTGVDRKGGGGQCLSVVDAAPSAVPSPAAAATLVSALAPRLALVAPAAWEDALGGAAAGGGCGRPASRLLPFAPGVGLAGGEEGEEGEDERGGGAWPADVDPVLVSAAAGKDGSGGGDGPPIVLAAAVGARDGRLAVGAPPPPAAAAAAAGGARLMAPALGAQPNAAPPSTTPVTVEALVAALKSAGLPGQARVAAEPAEVAALAAEHAAAAAALAGAAATTASSVSALVSLPEAGAAIVLAPGSTHVHAGSGVVRAAVLAAVDAARRGAA